MALSSKNSEEALHITLVYFSGRPDPTWNLPPSNQQYNQIMSLVNEAAASKLLGNLHEMPARLGYKGFLLRKNRTTHWIFGPGTKELQKVLLATAPEKLVSNKMKENISPAIDDNAS